MNTLESMRSVIPEEVPVKAQLQELRHEVIESQEPAVRTIDIDITTKTVHIPYYRKGKQYDFFVKKGENPNTIFLKTNINGKDNRVFVELDDIGQEDFIDTIYHKIGDTNPLFRAKATQAYQLLNALDYIYAVDYPHQSLYTNITLPRPNNTNAKVDLTLSYTDLSNITIHIDESLPNFNDNGTELKNEYQYRGDSRSGLETSIQQHLTAIALGEQDKETLVTQIHNFFLVAQTLAK